ncbi:hypothetical protein [Acidianus sulfidivorans]|uniref:hypothetical protein n=1 Tax=Acidianus sulfidivorans TaxID=312539 RepID=UPI00144313C2|nr:hypothetical protein [Acidianus sulfidivorans]
MIIIEEILVIIGLLMMPYGLYEIAKGDTSKDIKVMLIVISIGLYIAELLLVGL